MESHFLKFTRYTVHQRRGLHYIIQCHVCQFDSGGRIYYNYSQEYDDTLAQKIKHERFRWHNFQWLEMTTGESLYEEETDDLDEDYLDPSFLHTAAELYNNPDLYYEMQSQLEAAHGGGHTHAPQGGGGSSTMGGPGWGMTGYPFGEESDYYYDAMAMGGGGGDGVLRARNFVGANSSGPRQQQQPWNINTEEFANCHGDDDEIDESTLSPRQYALLMQSMQEPLAMYASTLESSYQDDNDLEGYSDGLNFSGSMQQRRAYPMSPNSQGLSFSMGGAIGGYQNLLQAGHVAPTTTTTNNMGDSLMVDPMMLYSPGGGGRFNPSPTYTYPPPSNLRPADEYGAMVQMRSPVPPSQANLSSSEGGPGAMVGEPGGMGYGDIDESLEVHPASMMSATYPGAAGGPPSMHVMPVPPPQSSRSRQYSRPATRQGF
jgi:hypothetical protein